MITPPWAPHQSMPDRDNEAGFPNGVPRRSILNRVSGIDDVTDVGQSTRRSMLGGLAAVAAGGLTVGSAIGGNHEDDDEVPMPDIEGPITGGARTGNPQTAALFDVAEHDYVEEEYFISGVARPYGSSLTGIGDSEEPAEYTTRMLVYRPKDRSDFSGRLFVNWANVSFQTDVPVAWIETYQYLLREGHAAVVFSAQKQGVDGSPLAGRNWDPVRYGDLSHPGDEYSYDMLSQAVQALRAPPGNSPNPDPMSGLPVRHVYAMGVSQSSGFLATYINDVQPRHGVIDGFMPQVSGSAADVVENPDVPVLWVNSEDEAGTVVDEDRDNFVLWEIAGGSHNVYWTNSWWLNMQSRDHGSVGGEGLDGAPVRQWGTDSAGQYGEQGSEDCPNNLFPNRYVYRAALEHLHEWAQNGSRPPVPDRFELNDNGETRHDEHGNVLGGLRLPPIDVPVAYYDAQSCGIFGATEQFDEATLRELYDDHEDYVAQMRVATGEAVDNGWLLPTDAEDLMARVEASSIPEPADDSIV